MASHWNYRQTFPLPHHPSLPHHHLALVRAVPCHTPLPSRLFTSTLAKGWFARNSPPGQHTSSPDTVMRLCVKTFSLTCQGSGESERGNAGPSSLQTSSGFPPDCLTPKTHIHTTWAPACADGISRKVWSSTTSLAVLLCVWVLALRPSTFVSQQVWVRFNSLRFGLLNICALLASSLNSKTLISTFFSFRRA